MTETLQLEAKTEDARRTYEAPKLLVEWSSPWNEFVTAIRPAMARSQARLAGEAPYGMFPFRGMLPTMATEALLIFAAIVIRVKIEQMRPYVVPRLSSHDVIYYTGDELPRTEDLGGAQTGTSGRSGGQEAHHRTQTIKIARGGSLMPQVVDAPSLKLPSSHDAVANLLAVKQDAGPPPAEGLRSARPSVTYQAPVVAPAPDVIHDYTRNGVKLDAVIAPPPVARDPFRAAPNLSATVVPPAPSVTSERTLVAPALGSAVIAPAPSISRDRVQAAPTLNSTVVAPAPSITRDTTRATPTFTSSVIAPAPAAVSRDLSSAPVQAAHVAVVPPPATAPERATTRQAKLTMPAPAVIEPAPSTDIKHDMSRVTGGSVPDPSNNVVAPPPTQAGSGSLVSSLLGKLFGPSEVVPPPPNVNVGSSGSANHSPTSNVVPPPPAVDSGGGSARGSRNGMGTSLNSNVIAPPPSAGLSGGTGTRSVADSKAPMNGIPNVVPPPPSLSGAGGGTGSTGGGKGAAGGTLLANNIVPPPPSVGGGTAGAGSGTGRKGPGLGTTMDAGTVMSPPGGGGSGAGGGIVASAQPGPKVGLPTTGGKGALAASPSGGDKPGVGGSSGGTGIGVGKGPGSGLNGEGSGAAKTGTGRGTDPAAHAGISPSSGPGGAGNAPNGNPTVPGVSVSGGTSVVTLPSFGDPSSGDPTPTAHSSAKHSQQLDVTIVATASSGGPFEPYKSRLHGEIGGAYIDTPVGTVVMEFSDENNSGRATAGNLSAPQGIRTDLPSDIGRTRMVIECTLDASGNLKNFHVLEPGSAGMTAKVLAALRSWKLQPATRGEQAIEVKAILGFGINTDDRY